MKTLYDELKSAEKAISRWRNNAYNGIVGSHPVFTFDKNPAEEEQEDKQRLHKYVEHLINSKYSQNPLIKKRVTGEVNFLDYIKPIAESYSNSNFHLRGRKLTVQLPKETEERAKILEEILPLEIDSSIGKVDFSKSGNYKYNGLYLTPLIPTIASAGGGVLFQHLPLNPEAPPGSKKLLLGFAAGFYALSVVFGVSFTGIGYLRDRKKLKSEVENLPRKIQETLTERAKYLDQFF